MQICLFYFYCSSNTCLELRTHECKPSSAIGQLMMSSERGKAGMNHRKVSLLEDDPTDDRDFKSSKFRHFV